MSSTKLLEDILQMTSDLLVTSAVLLLHRSAPPCRGGPPLQS